MVRAPAGGRTAARRSHRFDPAVADDQDGVFNRRPARPVDDPGADERLHGRRAGLTGSGDDGRRERDGEERRSAGDVRSVLGSYFVTAGGIGTI